MVRLFFLFISLMALTSCGMEKTGPSPGAPTASTAVTAPSPAVPGDFTLKSLEGKEVTLSEFRGKKAVLLVFWTTWCPNCKSEIPDLKKLQEKYRDGELTILSVSSGEKEKPVRSFAAKEGINYTVLMDTEGQVARAFGIVGVPTNLIINRKGELVYKEHELPRDLTPYLP